MVTWAYLNTLIQHTYNNIYNILAGKTLAINLFSSFSKKNFDKLSFRTDMENIANLSSN